MFYHNIMKITNIQNTTNFYNKPNNQKREFIDVLADNVKNPRDVNDCVAVPRGIFKAYLYLMAGSSTLMLANLIPSKLKSAKTATNILGIVLNFISAIYFAKPFAIKDLSPTIQKESLQNNKNK